MTSPRPFEPGPASGAPESWHVHASTCSRSYLVAAARAAAISVVLLGVLALVVLL